MKQSELFTKTFKESPKDEVSLNARLLIRAGFVDKLGAGIYTYLPLGLKVINKIESIVREEMNKLGAQEILMPALHPKENWDKTGRWDTEEMFKIKDENLGLGWTHEEIITPLLKKYMSSGNKYIYQIQTKFRNEHRSKSGILRGREFLMKDLYSFHQEGEYELNEFYEKVKNAYFEIFKKCGIGDKTYLTLASGGTFSQYSHEFQTVTDAGEDTIYICDNCYGKYLNDISLKRRYVNDEEVVLENRKVEAINKEIYDGKCPHCGNENLREVKSIEVGNIFKLGQKYTLPFSLNNDEGKPMRMGCYGIGISRLMGAIVEVFNDEKGIIWPKSVAPFAVHLISLDMGDAEIKAEADSIYADLQKSDIEVLYDNRDDKTAGEKLNDCDLIGIPLRLVVSGKTLKEKSVEVKKRNEEKTELVKIKDLVKYLK